MKRLSVAQVEYLAHDLACKLMDYDEPLPDFSTRYPGKLESCLAQPFQEFAGQAFYKSLEEKAAVLFYLITKNHPFENGNKRMAVTTTLLFLYTNGYWLRVSPEELYKIALDVAESKPVEKDKILYALSGTFKEFKEVVS